MEEFVILKFTSFQNNAYRPVVSVCMWKVNEGGEAKVDCDKA